MKKLKQKEESLIKYVEQLDEENVLKLADELLDQGIDPLRVLELINEGVNRVGKLYESKEYYIADLIMAGIIFKQVLALEKMVAYFKIRHSKKAGKVVLGTVSGDIHDIGKEIFRGMMDANGFEVIDLGVDVSKELFVKKVLECKPDIVGLSGILTSTIEAMKEVIEALTEAGLREQVKVIIGGSHINRNLCEFIGADSYANDASDGVKTCIEWVESGNREEVPGND